MATTVLRDAESVSRFHAHWNQRIDQLADGALGEEDFITEMMRLDGGARDYPWAVIAIMDRRVRRGQLGEELFRGIEARIAQREFALESELTVDLPAPPPRIVTQRIRQLTAGELAAGQSANDAPAPPVPVVSELAAGTVLNERYVIRSVIGEGGMGRVYQALDRQRRDHGEIESHVAVKVLRESTDEHSQALERLTREFETARKLSHRNIIRVFELGRDGPLDFFTMEFLIGEVMSKFLARFHREPLPRDEAWGMIRDIGSALTHAHALGAVHGDLQPHNIMMLKSGELKLMDFGAGASIDINQATPGYASLEQLAGLPPEPRDDLFALACLSYELLAGTHPYGHRRASEAQRLGLIPQLPRGLTPSQGQLLQAALAFERAGRPESVRAWLEGMGLENSQVAPALPAPIAWAPVAPLAVFADPEPEQVAVPAHAFVDPEPEQLAAPVHAFVDPEPEQPAAPAQAYVDADAEQLAAPAHAFADLEPEQVFPTPHAWLDLEPTRVTSPPHDPLPSAATSPVSRLEGSGDSPFEAANADTPEDASLERTVDMTPESLRAALSTVPEMPLPVRPALHISAALPEVVPIAHSAPHRTSRVPRRNIVGGAAALLAAVCAAFWLVHMPRDQELPPVAATPAPVAPAPAAEMPQVVTPARPAARPAARAAAAPKVIARNVPRVAPTPGGTVALTGKAYRIGPGGRFAEIKVTRTDASKPLSFTWWTEDGTARAGSDYLATPKSTAYVAAGARSVSLFVKTVGHGPRKQPAHFTVQIARPSVGVLGNARATVTLEAGR